MTEGFPSPSMGMIPLALLGFCLSNNLKVCRAPSTVPGTPRGCWGGRGEERTSLLRDGAFCVLGYGDN